MQPCGAKCHRAGASTLERMPIEQEWENYSAGGRMQFSIQPTHLDYLDSKKIMT